MIYRSCFSDFAQSILQKNTANTLWLAGIIIPILNITLSMLNYYKVTIQFSVAQYLSWLPYLNIWCIVACPPSPGFTHNQKHDKLTPLESLFCRKAELPGPFNCGYLDLNLASCSFSISCWDFGNWKRLIYFSLHSNSSIHENHRAFGTLPMAGPQCLARDFTILNRIQSSAVITRSNSSPYYTWHCDNSGRKWIR